MLENFLKEDLKKQAEAADVPSYGTKENIYDRMVKEGIEPVPSADETDDEPDELVVEPADAPDEFDPVEPAPVIPADDKQVAPNVVTSAQAQSKPVALPEELTPDTKGYAVDDSGHRLVKMTKPAMMHGLSDGRAFRRSHPFLLMQPDEAEVLVNATGFRYATMEEAKEYYS